MLIDFGIKPADFIFSNEKSDIIALLLFTNNFSRKVNIKYSQNGNLHSEDVFLWAITNKQLLYGYGNAIDLSAIYSVSLI